MPVEIRPDHVAAYVRWSTDEQTAGTTLHIQRDACTHFILSQGWQVRDDLVFVDDGFSGATLDRPAMWRLRSAIERAEVDCVVVMKIDRLSRNIVDAVDLVLREWQNRCHLKSAREALDTTTDMGRVFFNILATFADFERTTIRERTHGGKTKRIRDGEQMHGRPAFGYGPHSSLKGRWVEHPEEAAMVRRMFHLAAEGMSATRLVRLLNGEGARTRSGKAWSSPSMLHLLHNKTYIGVVEYGRTTVTHVAGRGGSSRADSFADQSHRPKKVRVRNAEPKVLGKTDAAPALVDEETFARVQVLLAANRRRRDEMGGRAMGSPHLLVGLVQCECGAPLVHTGRGARTPASAGYYLCARHRVGLCQASGHIPSRAAEQIVEQSFLALFGVREMRSDAFGERITAADQDCAAIEACLSGLQVDLRRFEQEDQRLLRAARAGEVPFSSLGDLRSSLSRDREAAEARLQALREQQEEARLRVRSFRVSLDALDAVDQWESLEVWQRRQLLRMCLDGRITMMKTPGEDEIRVSAPWWVSG